MRIILKNKETLYMMILSLNAVLAKMVPHLTKLRVTKKTQRYFFFRPVFYRKDRIRVLSQN